MNKENMFEKYHHILHSELKDYGVLNYLSSHDDGQPFDAAREKPYEAATKLLLCPGTSQVYYGDESGRPLVIKDTQGDATLRSNMNWNAIKNNPETKAILSHWQKIGQFRVNHPALGAGIHQMITQKPYVFYRSYQKDGFIDLVVVGLDLPKGEKILDISKVFEDGDLLFDAYSNQTVKVKSGKVILKSDFETVLLEKK